MTEERLPDAAEVARLVQDVVPGVRAADIRPIGEGGDHASWWVGPDHVVRCALDSGGSERLRRELALRELVGERTGVPVPESVASGDWVRGRAFTLDTRLDGVSAELRPVPATGEEDLVRMLVALARLPVADAEALGVPPEAPRNMPGLLRRAATAAETVAARGEFDAAWLPRLHVRGAEAAAGPATLVHNDLKGEHLLVSDDGRISGVLDWTDAVTGDAAEDVAGLAISVGAVAAVRVATAAGFDRGACARALQLARCDTLTLLSDRLGGRDDSPLPLLRAQLRRAWEPTALDRAEET
ncbi:aminoglycoside phosphotransferase family protein [Streptomyces albofaciens JCM 4342]|uniref:phosphotransferase family protein n=1 Tax=Streptomyces albofaciens TaxID=66866 RepID=UPI00123A9924|nr:aminoglycoside phosphotransferase family protein [Streptomyces albofaciens]KAA6224398.1 aminoglycoside phosphotransferase family protein [Streptomyces albofaciens JCM 4342]